MKHFITNSKGQAIAETVVTVSVIGMILFASVSLYQLLNADLNANKAARLAVWHGVLYQGLNDQEMEEKYRSNINGTLLSDADDQRELIGRTSTGRERIYGSSDIEFETLASSPTYAFPSNRSSFIGNLAGLNQNSISTIKLSIPLGDLLVTKNTDSAARDRSSAFCPIDEGYDSCSGRLVEVAPPYDPIADSYRLNLRGQAALLSNGFVPSNEAAFGDAIGNVASDGWAMTYFEVFRGPLAFLGFEEADLVVDEEGLSTVAEDQSRVLPTQLGTFE